MIAYIQAWIITTVVFLLADVPWLYFVMNKHLVKKIHHLMDMTAHGPVIIFSSAITAYLLISFGIVWFVIIPYHKASFSTLFTHGALLGLCMYGVYEFTNHATLLNWPMHFLMVDIAWGTFVCGLTSVLSSKIIQFFNIAWTKNLF